MAKGEYLGEFSQVVLLGVLRLGENAYGTAIRREIRRRTGQDISIGAVYATLDRLEEKGFVSSSANPARPLPDGRARRFFRVERAGRAALRESARAVAKMAEGVLPETPRTARSWCMESEHDYCSENA